MGTNAGDSCAEAVVVASRALVAVTARSVAAAEDTADLVGIRVLVTVAARQSVSLHEVAEALGVHVSTASRVCDRMVARGLLDRRDDPADRRQLALRVTAEGDRVVSAMRTHRRRAVGRILDRMTGEQRAQLTAGLEAFAAAAGDVPERDLWAIGWAH